MIEEEVALAERFGAPRAVGVARRAAGLLARGEASVELLRSAVDVLAGSGARVELARALADLGAATRRTGRSRRPVVLHRGLELADSVGADEVASRAREELRLAGGRATRRPSAPADRLTPGERRVAGLAAAGTATGRSPTRSSSPSRPWNGTSVTPIASSRSKAARNWPVAGRGHQP